MHMWLSKPLYVIMAAIELNTKIWPMLVSLSNSIYKKSSVVSALLSNLISVIHLNNQPVYLDESWYDTHFFGIHIPWRYYQSRTNKYYFISACLIHKSNFHEENSIMASAKCSLCWNNSTSNLLFYVIKDIPNMHCILYAFDVPHIYITAFVLKDHCCCLVSHSNTIKYTLWLERCWNIVLRGVFLKTSFALEQ